MKTVTHFDLSTYLSFRMGPIIHTAIIVEKDQEIEDIFHLYPNASILGGGTNTLVGKEKAQDVWLINQMMGWQMESETVQGVRIRIQSGQNMDAFIQRSVENGYQGMESLSGIPGSLGGAAMMNAGAYGHELKDVIESVQVYDRFTHQIKTFSKAELGMGYRTSIFQQDPQRWFIQSVVVSLIKGSKQALVQKRSEIVDQRFHRIPNLQRYPSCGSFFRNVIVAKSQAIQLQKQFPTLKMFDLPADHIKISTGSILKTLWPKGFHFQGIRMYPDSPLILINEGATMDSVSCAIQTILEKVYAHTKIQLEPEVRLMGIPLGKRSIFRYDESTRR
ncbi:UDP-N-acetylmuramate dehydrogenase [Absicoccus intestinalis]|uniref:UDP-N-acetylenolpyruvoylglucosamine reductase n=1 Tax=Absicoccus intestinalis TaxID=2926319 RepID=A0ABU4WNG3_9FIRM|nr:FAD-binding protein [Absicoccus sp. CLA-KB-P134]MDX8417283.1 FAD-binding protein [Absicoccus sp. CLA-KB-P134]